MALGLPLGLSNRSAIDSAPGPGWLTGAQTHHYQPQTHLAPTNPAARFPVSKAEPPFSWHDDWQPQLQQAAPFSPSETEESYKKTGRALR